jgi:tyrosine-protein kinase Etk/Wzc
MSEPDFLNFVRVLDRWKRPLIALVLGTAIVSAAISYVLPKWYMARAVILPPQDSELGSALGSLLQGITLPGVGNVTPAGSETQLFVTILDSRTLRTKLVERFDLMRVYKAKNIDEAVRSHRLLARAGITDEGAVEILVEDRDPKRAADQANAWVGLLDEYNKTSRMSSARRNREFVEARLRETTGKLAAAEDRLAAYQREHKAVPLTADVSAAVEVGANLMARRVGLVVQLNRYEAMYRGDTPQVTQARADLAALDREIDRLPPLAIDFARLLRDMKVEEQVFALLTAQYEEARIREVKDTPTIEILDEAVPPFRRSRPIRWLFVSSLTGAALVLSIGFAFGVEFLRRLRESARLAS